MRMHQPAMVPSLVDRLVVMAAASGGCSGGDWLSKQAVRKSRFRVFYVDLKAALAGNDPCRRTAAGNHRIAYPMKWTIARAA
jgi:hypothetical protein